MRLFTALAFVLALASCRGRKEECKDVLGVTGGDDARVVGIGEEAKIPPASASPAEIVAAADRLALAVRALKVSGDLTSRVAAYATAVDDVRSHTEKFRATGSPFGDAGASLANTGLTGKYAEQVQALLLVCGPDAKEPACDPVLAANAQFMKAHPGKTVSAVCGEIAAGLEAEGGKAADPKVKSATAELAKTFRELEAQTKLSRVTWDDFQSTSAKLQAEQTATLKARADVGKAGADLRAACAP